jgi:hypothetical protein
MYGCPSVSALHANGVSCVANSPSASLEHSVLEDKYHGRPMRDFPLNRAITKIIPNREKRMLSRSASGVHRGGRRRKVLCMVDAEVYLQIRRSASLWGLKCYDF